MASKDAKKEKALKVKVAKTEKVAKPKAEKEPKAPKEPGVIASIVALCSAKALTKAEIIQGLVKRFPDRTAEAMKFTVDTQLSGRLRTKGFTVTKAWTDDDHGFRYTVVPPKAKAAAAKAAA